MSDEANLHFYFKHGIRRIKRHKYATLKKPYASPQGDVDDISTKKEALSDKKKTLEVQPSLCKKKGTSELILLRQKEPDCILRDMAFGYL